MKKTYYLFNPGRLSRNDNTLKFVSVNDKGTEQQPRYLPVENVGELYIFGSLDANTSLYNFLGKNDISVHFFDYYENYTGSFMPRENLLSGKMLLAQASFHQNKKKRLGIANKIIDGAATNILRNLKYYQNRGKQLASYIDVIESFHSKTGQCSEIEELMGIEGNIRNIYYEAFDIILNDFEMGKRSRQPPRNEVNSLISFGNMMCYSQCLRAIHQTQLNPTISYLHSPGERRYSLALDIAEIFKPLLVDRVIFKVLNKNEIKHTDFNVQLNKILLKERAKKTFISAMEQKLKETIMHRSLKRKVSYKYLIKLECYKLAKHLLGMEEYKPFKAWW